MKHKIFSLLSLLVAVMLFAACAPKSVATGTPDVASDNSMEPTPVVQGDPTEAQTRLIKDLSAAGANVELGDSVEQAFFTVKGRILKVNGADMQVYEYDSTEAMEADAAQVAPDGGSIGTSMVMWVEAPHFFKSGNVLVLYVGEDAAVLDLLKGALGEQFAGR